MRSELDKARVLLEEKRPTGHPNYLWTQTLALEGRRSEALQTMDQETLQFARVVFFATPETADFYAAVGHSSKAIDWIRQAVRNGDERTDWFRRNPRLQASKR